MAARKSISSAYERLRTLHGLPPYKQLASEFDIGSVPHDTANPAREIAKKVFERTDAFRKILEGLLQPEGLAEMQEADSIPPAMSEEIARILRELMRIDRDLLLAELDNGEQAYAAFIRTAAAAWFPLKERLKPVCLRLAGSWSVPAKSRNALNYMG